MRWFVIPKMAVSLPLAVLAAVILIATNEAGFHLSTQATTRLEETHATRGTVTKLLQHMLDAETGQRGYLLTGNPHYLDPYNAATTDLNQTLEALRRHYAPYPAELAEFGALSVNVSRKLAEMDLSVRMRNQGNEDAWKFVLTTDVGMEQMNVIRSQIAKLVDASNRKMGAAEAHIGRSLQIARFGIGLVTLAGLVAFYLYLRQSRALLVAGQREQLALQQERDYLDKEVRERTATLAELATHLQQVREDERGHLARELHDELGALLTAAKLDVARIKSRLGEISPEANERIQHLIETLNSGIALKRRIVEDLRPSALSNLGLVASLEILTREFVDRSDVSISTDLNTVELNDSAQLTVYRLVQESLTNMGKYAEARQAHISLHDRDGFVTVSVKDNGCGFDTTQIKPSSHGLAGMKHRVEASGGRLSIHSTPGRGTTVTAVIPKAL